MPLHPVPTTSEAASAQLPEAYYPSYQSYPTYYTTNLSQGYQILPPVAAPAIPQQQPSVPAAAAQEVKPVASPSKCSLCVLHFFTLLALIIAAVSLGLGTYNHITLTKFKSQFSVEKTFPFQTKSNYYYDNKPRAVSMINYGKVTHGFGYKINPATYPSMGVSTPADTKSINLTDSVMMTAYAASNIIYVTLFNTDANPVSFGYQNYIRYGYYVDKVLSIVNVPGDYPSDNKFIIFFSDQQNNIQSIVGHYPSSANYFTFDNKFTTIYTQQTHLYDRTINVTSIALDETKMVVGISYAGRQTVLLGCKINSDYRITCEFKFDTTVKDCRAISLARYNTTNFFMLCDSELIYGKYTDKVFGLPSSVSSTVVPSPDRAIWGPVMTNDMSNDTAIIYYADENRNLKTVVIRVRTLWDEYHIYVSTDKASIIETSIDLSKTVSMISAGPFGLYFTFYKNNKMVVKNAILSTGISTAIVQSSPQSQPITNDYYPNIYTSPLGMFVPSRRDVEGNNVPSIVYFIPSSNSIVTVDIYGGFFPIGVTKGFDYKPTVNVVLRGIIPLQNLLPGSRYFAQQNGEIGISGSNGDVRNVVAGIAISENELLISDMN